MKDAFVKFIDENCDCLCPLLLSTGMKLDLHVKEKEDEEETIVVEVVLPPIPSSISGIPSLPFSLLSIESTPIGISPSLFLNDLIDIEVEVVNVVQASVMDNLEHLRSCTFDLKLFDSKLVDFYCCFSNNCLINR